MTEQLYAQAVQALAKYIANEQVDQADRLKSEYDETGELYTDDDVDARYWINDSEVVMLYCEHIASDVAKQLKVEVSRIMERR